MRKLSAVFVVLLAVLVLFSGCAPSSASDGGTGNQTPAITKPDDSDSGDGCLSGAEISLVYEAAKKAKSYMLDNVADLKDKSLLSEWWNPTSVVYTLRSDLDIPVTQSSTLKSLSIRKSAVATTSRQGTGASSFKGNIAVNGKEYSVSYSYSNEGPSLIINGVTVY